MKHVKTTRSIKAKTTPASDMDEARRAARVLETAVGEALGPAQWGGDRRSDQVVHKQLEAAIAPELASRVLWTAQAVRRSPPR